MHSLWDGHPLYKNAKTAYVDEESNDNAFGSSYGDIAFIENEEEEKRKTT